MYNKLETRKHVQVQRQIRGNASHHIAPFACDIYIDWISISIFYSWCQFIIIRFSSMNFWFEIEEQKLIIFERNTLLPYYYRMNRPSTVVKACGSQCEHLSTISKRKKLLLFWFFTCVLWFYDDFGEFSKTKLVAWILGSFFRIFLSNSHSQ